MAIKSLTPINLKLKRFSKKEAPFTSKYDHHTADGPGSLESIVTVPIESAKQIHAIATGKAEIESSLLKFSITPVKTTSCITSSTYTILQIIDFIANNFAIPCLQIAAATLILIKRINLVVGIIFISLMLAFKVYQFIRVYKFSKEKILQIDENGFLQISKEEIEKKL